MITLSAVILAFCFGVFLGAGFIDKSWRKCAVTKKYITGVDGRQYNVSYKEE